jgi:tetratricopeptide (TPR) repeat protein
LEPEEEFHLGIVLAATGHFDQALPKLKAAVESGRKTFRAYFALGYSYYETKDYIRGQAAIREALSLASTDQQRDRAQTLLAVVEAKLSEAEKERREGEAVASRRFDDPARFLPTAAPASRLTSMAFLVVAKSNEL